MLTIILLAIVNLCLINNCLGNLSQSQKEQILNDHNNYRQSIANEAITNQPSATNMIKLIWSDEAAAKAQAHADKCRFAHDRDSDRKYGDYEHVGQNLAMYMGYPYNHGVKLWFDEHKGYDYNSNYCFLRPCGHYTQLVWANTEEIGCGLSKCRKENKMMMMLVCNYAPAGNFNFQLPYESGPTCSNCTETTQCIDGLCA